MAEINQAVCEPIVRRSFLDSNGLVELPTVLLGEIGLMLGVDEAFAKFPYLNKEMNRLFFPELTEEERVVMWNRGDFMYYCYRKFMYHPSLKSY